MSVPNVKFNTKDQPEFYKVLSKRVNQHFRDNNISKNANLSMVLKTIFMVTLYFTPLFLMLAGVVNTISAVLLMWFIMGFGKAGIGLSVMHDANHGSYSRNPKINNAVGFLINFIGGYHVNWKIQHNVLHHSYTNIEGYDDDIAKTHVLRLSPDQVHKNKYHYQAFYAPFLYGLMTLYWCLGKDFEQLFKYNKKNLIAGQGLSFKKALFQILFNKTWYFILLLVLPFIYVNVPWYVTLSGFLMMHFMTGLILALIFQPAHVIEETNFYIPDEKGSVENNWAIHQMNTTSNFANDSVLFSWFVGGLNYQIEHHLFPHICHIHYRDISSIVKATAKEYNIPYHQHPTFYAALKSHFTLLDQLGKNTFQLNLEKA